MSRVVSDDDEELVAMWCFLNLSRIGAEDPDHLAPSSAVRIRFIMQLLVRCCGLLLNVLCGAGL